MPRTARIVVPDVSHHITQRGNNRQDVFFVDDDRRVYLSILKEQSEQYGLAIRRNTHTGRPLADDAFISKLEKLLNKRLRPLPIGRPGKQGREK